LEHRRNPSLIKGAEAAADNPGGTRFHSRLVVRRPSEVKHLVTQLARDTPTAIGGMASFYRAFYDHDQTKATTHLNDNIAAYVLNNIFTPCESRLVTPAGAQEVLEGQIACQTDTDHRLTAAIGHRRTRESSVLAFPGSLANASDEDLMRRVQAGDTRAFEERYDRLLPGLSGLLASSAAILSEPRKPCRKVSCRSGAREAAMTQLVAERERGC